MSRKYPECITRRTSSPNTSYNFMRGQCKWYNSRTVVDMISLHIKFSTRASDSRFVGNIVSLWSLCDSFKTIYWIVPIKINYGAGSSLQQIPRTWCWLRDLARRLPELRRALTLARRPLGLRHALDLAGLVRSLSPRQPRAWCGAYLPASLVQCLSPREPRPEYCFARDAFLLVFSFLVLVMISFSIYVYPLLSLYDRRFNHYHHSLPPLIVSSPSSTSGFETNSHQNLRTIIFILPNSEWQS
jgi:hypothetical protein